MAPHTRFLTVPPVSGRRGFHRKSACRRRHTGQPSDRRRRPANRRLRPQSRDSVPRGARAGKASPASAPSAHQQRQRLPRPPQTVAQPLQRRRHQEPAKLSRMAPRSRSLGRQTRTAKLDQRRDRKRTIPTANGIRAQLLQNLLFRSRTPKALPSLRIKLQGGEGWPARTIFSSRSYGPASGARGRTHE